MTKPERLNEKHKEGKTLRQVENKQQMAHLNFNILTFTFNVKKLNMLNISQSVSLDQKSKTQLYAIIGNTL